MKIVDLYSALREKHL